MATVLHVDDEYPNSAHHGFPPKPSSETHPFFVLASYLGDRQCELVPCRNFDEAIRAYRNHRFPEVVILDLIDANQEGAPLEGLRTYLNLREGFDQAAWQVPHIVIYTSADLNQRDVVASLQGMCEGRNYHVAAADVFVVKKTLNHVKDAEDIFRCFPRALQNRQQP